MENIKNNKFTLNISLFTRYISITFHIYVNFKQDNFYLFFLFGMW